MPDLSSLRQQYDNLITHTQDVFSNVEEHTASQRPVTGRWSMAECVAHLNVTGEPYLERLASVMDAAEREGTARRRNPGPGLFARWISRTLEPPYRLKMKTMTRFEPQAGAGLAQTLSMFEKQQHEFLGLIDIMESQGVPRLRIPSPVQPLLRLHADDWLHFLAAHARRHLWQASQVQKEIST